ncbi:DUF6973 domain-containing protein [Psychrobacillus sp. NPDC093180]|uniref:DUF6973 domain-containing protein n=1 Tax=Psychrobacillus sp. NPDC093180 TaxID=3364489 RepID=UPI00381C1CFD
MIIMKRFSILILGILSLFVLQVDKGYAQTPDELTLTIEVVNSLTQEDFANAFEILTLNNDISALTNEELERKTVIIINDIYQSKQNKITPFIFGIPLNETEVLLAANYPYEAAAAYSSSDVAKQRVAALFTAPLADHGNANAFKHAYWNVEMSFHLTQRFTKMFADAHEANASGLAKEMDLYNNEYGRNLFLRMVSENKNLTAKQAETELLKRISNGNLLRKVGEQLRNTDGTGRK